MYFLFEFFNIIWWTKHNSTQTIVTLQISSKSADGMDRLFVGELPGGTPNTVASHESRCLISPTIRLFLKSLFRLTTHETSKLSIIGPMLGNHRSSVDSPNKGPATREAFRSGRMIGRVTRGGTRSENRWGCAAGHWKLDPKRSREKWNLGPKRLNSVRIGSFSSTKDIYIYIYIYIYLYGGLLSRCWIYGMDNWLYPP